MKRWSTKQVASALYSQLFLISLSLRKVVEALEANAHGAVNGSRHPSGPEAWDLARQAARDEEREIPSSSPNRNNANETFDDWLRRQAEADEALESKTGIDEGTERAGSTAHESE